MASPINIVPSDEILAAIVPPHEVYSKQGEPEKWLRAAIDYALVILGLEDDEFSTKYNEGQLGVQVATALACFAGILQLALTVVMVKATSGQAPLVTIQPVRGTVTYALSGAYVAVVERLLTLIRDHEVIQVDDCLRLSTTIVCWQIKTKRRLNELSRISLEHSQKALEQAAKITCKD